MTLAQNMAVLYCTEFIFELYSVLLFVHNLVLSKLNHLVLFVIFEPPLVIRTVMHMLLVTVSFTHIHIHGHSLAPRAHKNGKLEEDHVTIIIETGQVLSPSLELVTHPVHHFAWQSFRM